MSVLLQYVKDLSFENPGAPASLGPRPKPPQINISIGVQSQQVGQHQYEVEIKIDAKATDGTTGVFQVELVYAGVFQLQNIPQDQLRPLLLIECPRLLFPFARQVVAESTRNGGFPPLLIDPVDFTQMYRQQLAQQSGGNTPPAPQRLS
jgi:preprotein translocase subunit SecB